MKKIILSLILIVTILTAGILIFGADNVLKLIVGVLLFLALPALAASKKPQPYWERNYKG